MKLFKFPVLVFDNIIKQLDPIPLVSLSFCSKKTRHRIKKVRFAIKDTWFLNEFEEKNARGYRFAVKFPSQHILYVSSQKNTKKLKKYAKKFIVQIENITYGCRKIEEHEPYRSDFYLGCIGYKKTYVFFNYILDLVRTGITDIWINLNKLVNIKQFLSEPVFKNVQKIMLLGKSVDSKKVNELYDCFEKPMLETRVKPHIESLSPTSKLLQSENLEFKPSKSISIEHLLNFNGKYIDLERSLLQEEDIVAFIKHWLDGNYPNLEGAYITCQGNSEYETEKVLDEFNTKQWNPAERAQNFILKASYYRDEKDGFPKVDCANGYDLERSDGLLATILFGEHDDAFNFFVWHNRFP